MFVAIVTAAVTLGPAAAGATAPEGEPGRLIVVFEDGRVASEDRGDVHAAAGADQVDRIGAMNLDVVEVDDVDDAIRAYERRPDVKYVEVDAPVEMAAPNDPLYEHQWNLEPSSSSNRGTANVEGAWSRSKGRNVVVAVVDTGVRVGGSDLASSRVLAGRDFVNDDDDATDDNGHGTHIAGTIAQSTGNGVGVAGIAPEAKILPVKVLNAAGAGTYSDVIDGILWAKDRSDVINLSLAGATHSQALCDAVSDAAASAVVVAASGNNGNSSVSYPAACDDAIAVGSVRRDGARAGYSNTGSALDFVAPGGDLDVDQNGDGYGDGILQQTNDGTWGYVFYEGTSMAAAHVSGVAALIKGVKSNANVEKTLRKTVRDLGASGRDNQFGHGAIDAAAAVKSVVSSSKKSGTSTGYWLAARQGDVHAFGRVSAHGHASSSSAAIVSIEPTPSGKGYWLLDSAGGIFTFGDAGYHGSIPGLRQQGQRIGPANPVDIAATPSGKGYWILDSAGGIFTFGDATFYGSIPGLRQKGQRIGQADPVDIAATPSGKGYWILDSAGGIFTFGDARFFGSVPGLRLAGQKIGQAKVMGLAPTVTGRGYWLVDDQGGMFTFGDARFYGSVPGRRLAGQKIGEANVIAMAATSSGKGYWLVDDAGGVFTFGDAGYFGSMPAIGAQGPSVGIAAVG